MYDKEIQKAVDILRYSAIALEPYNDEKPRDWKTDRERLREAYKQINDFLHSACAD